MRFYRNLLLSWLTVACVSPWTAVRADVVVDMPAPPKAADTAGEVEPTPAATPAADSAAGTAEQSGPGAAQPTVGQIALIRYARARSRPNNTYYVSGYSRFGGCYWPSHHWYWGPYNLGGLNFFWPGWTWGHWSFTVNCTQGDSESSGSGSSDSD
jgi:hypothetical protein